jgi:hypothetical protein
MIMNPKFMMQIVYTGGMLFGAYHFTKISLAIIGSNLLSKTSKPKLVRETSKIFSNNYLTLPFVYARK